MAAAEERLRAAQAHLEVIGAHPEVRRTHAALARLAARAGDSRRSQAEAAAAASLFQAPGMGEGAGR